MSFIFLPKRFKGAHTFAPAYKKTCEGSLIIHHSTPRPYQEVLCDYPFTLSLVFGLGQLTNRTVKTALVHISSKSHWGIVILKKKKLIKQQNIFFHQKLVRH
jgi:hypothetical protein